MFNVLSFSKDISFLSSNLQLQQLEADIDREVVRRNRCGEKNNTKTFQITIKLRKCIVTNQYNNHGM